jgi:hypothetical protein
MVNNLELLDSIKYENEEEIESFVEDMAYKFRDRKDELVRMIQGDTLLAITHTDEERIVKAIFLSLVLTTITSNLYNPILRNELIQKFKNLSNRFHVPYSELVRLTQYEDQLKQIIF